MNIDQLKTEKLSGWYFRLGSNIPIVFLILRLAHQKQLLTSNLHMEIKGLKVLDGLVHGAEENIKKANKLYKLVQKEYERGVKNSEDMLLATEKLINTETKRNQIIKDFHYARIHIMTKIAE